MGGDFRWHAVVHLGFESAAKGLQLEIAASNVLAVPNVHTWSADVPCNKSGTARKAIDEDAPCLLATTAPLDRLAMPLPARSKSPPPELWSRDAGSFFCNEVYFRSLHAVRSSMVRVPCAELAGCEHGVGTPPRLLPVVFVHLPLPTVAGVEDGAAFIKQLLHVLTS